MTENDFRRVAIKAVVDYTNKHIDKTDDREITAEDVYVVWQVKVLQNNKALLSTNLSDGMYYECTYNGDKDEMYVDCYKKQENFCVSSKLTVNKIYVEGKDISEGKSYIWIKFPIGTSVEVTDELQLFPSSRYLIEHGLFSHYCQNFFKRMDICYDTTNREDILSMRATVCDVEYDNSGKRYVYIIQTNGNKVFAVAENGLAPLAEENPQ